MNIQTSEATTAQLEVLQSLTPVAEKHIDLLAPIADAWQPTDYLPDLTAEDAMDQLKDFRAANIELGDELLVILVGDMVTEEALPNYAISLNLLANDFTGTSEDAWARWMRGWTAEENRHGDLLNAYLRLTGRVDMRAVEVTVHHLIAGGFNPRAYPDPYAGLIYTSFQERATKISHMNTGRMAARAGSTHLGDICKRIAGDESRHEVFYTRMTSAVFKQDPERAVVIFRNMMRRIITMPGKQMYDGQDPNLFDHFAAIAQRTSIYTVHDYLGIMRHLIDTWEISKLAVSGQAAKAQDWLCGQVDRLATVAEMVSDEAAKQGPTQFSWIHGRKV